MNAITILGKPYQIHYVDKVDDDDNSGESNIRTGEIKVLNALTPHLSRETLLHEIIHIVSDELYLELSERQVAALSVGLYSVYRDNHLHLVEPPSI